MSAYYEPDLRDYQREPVEEAAAHLDAGRRTIIQCPTGGGKTEMAIVLVKRHLSNSIRRESKEVHPRALWLTHREELRRQTGSRFNRYGVDTTDLSERKPQDRKLKRGELAIVSPQVRNVHALASQADEHDLLVVDEAHHSPAATWAKLINEWPGKVLDLTATPWRLSEKEGFDHLFNALVTGPSINRLRDRGYLSNYALYAPGGAHVVGGTVRGGDYAPDDIDVRVLATNKVVEAWSELKPSDARTIWYVPTQSAARQLHDTLSRFEIDATIILSETTPEERRPALARFSNNEINHIINVMTLTEGIDVPEANCIVFARPTKSLTLFLQVMGRGLRPMGGKKAILIDLGHSFKNFGIDPFDTIEWALDPRGPQVMGDTPMKTCPNCASIIHTGCRTCPACEIVLGEECVGCRRFAFYESAGCGGKDRLSLKISISQFHGRNDEKFEIIKLIRRIKLDGGLHCKNCAIFTLSGFMFPWTISQEGMPVCVVNDYQMTLSATRNTRSGWYAKRYSVSLSRKGSRIWESRGVDSLEGTVATAEAELSRRMGGHQRDLFRVRFYAIRDNVVLENSYDESSLLAERSASLSYLRNLIYNQERQTLQEAQEMESNDIEKQMLNVLENEKLPWRLSSGFQGWTAFCSVNGLNATVRRDSSSRFYVAVGEWKSKSLPSFEIALQTANGMLQQLR